MKPWITRLWLGFVVMLGVVLGALFLWDVRTAAKANEAMAPPEIGEKGIFGLEERHEMRWVGLNRPPRNMQTFKADVTAYSPSRDETDDTPCHTANGTSICGEDARADAIAINGLPMGTRVWSDVTGFRVVSDRMNSRYGMERADIPMLGVGPDDPSAKAKAKAFGIRKGILFTIVE